MLKPVVCIYCEGNDTKIAVATKEDGVIKILRTASFDFVQPHIDNEDPLTSINLEEEDLSLSNLQGDVSTTTTPQMSSTMAVSGTTLVSSALKDFNLTKFNFIPALTEPQIYYHTYEGAVRDKSGKLTKELVNDLQQNKDINIAKDTLNYIELSDKSILAVFLSGEVNCIKLINAVARANGKRYYKVPSVKTSDISLAYYVAKKKKFFPDDNSLIVYIGKEYSKLIFLQGKNLKHIGSTLDIGTVNLHTYDVYFSKILLEMENGGISHLDNIIVCGEDDSENLILSFYGTFPEANVSRLEFEEIDISLVDQKNKEIFSSFSVPVAVATEYYDELEGLTKGINLLPKYIKEDQKFIQFAWHGYAMLPLLFLSAFLITTKVLQNNKAIGLLDTQIQEKTKLLQQNQEIVNKITDLELKISSFDQTQIILDSASVGTGNWSKVLEDISDYINARKNLWITRVTEDNTKLVVEGYTLSKNLLTEFAKAFHKAELKSIVSEQIQEKNTYKFILIFNIADQKR